LAVAARACGGRCIDITGTSFITIEGITVQNCRGVGIEALGVSDVTVRAVTVRMIGGTGIEIRGLRSGLRDSTLHDIGCRASIVHGGNATLLIPGNMFAINNTIHDFAQCVQHR
jgi:hypothetical protein